jgi:hypothetical protein
MSRDQTSKLLTYGAHFTMGWILLLGFTSVSPKLKFFPRSDHFPIGVVVIFSKKVRYGEAKTQNLTFQKVEGSK